MNARNQSLLLSGSSRGRRIGRSFCDLTVGLVVCLALPAYYGSILRGLVRGLVHRDAGARMRGVVLEGVVKVGGAAYVSTHTGALTENCGCPGSHWFVSPR